jgi:hypothetical protein
MLPMNYRKILVFVVLQFLALLSWQGLAVAAQLRLNWSDNSTNENGFEIERRTATTAFTRIATVASNINTYTDSGLADGTQYCYRVRAYNSNGSSSYTSEVCATTPVGTATLAVSRVGNGTVTSSPAGINCSSDCSEVYATGTIVTLTATPASGSTFSGWSGGGCSGTGSCILNITANTSITATFTTTTTPVTLAVNRIGNGTVTSSPAGINCSTDCSEAYAPGTNVTLTATPASGSTFAGWSGGGCSGTGNCVLNLNTATTVTATFSTNSSCSAGQFLAEYFNNTALSGSPVFTTCVSTINHNWGSGGPGNGIGNDQFSARWTGSFNFNASGYDFSATADDGIRVWVDGNQIINAWRDQAPTTYRAAINLAAGSHVVKVEYYEKSGGAVAQVSWQASVSTPSTPTVNSITPNPINLATPPSSFTIAGGGFANLGFGLPIVNFTRGGTLLGQARAGAMSGSMSLTVPFPTNATSLVGPLPGLSAGTVSVEVYNQTGATTYSLPGSIVLTVNDTTPPPPQPGVSSITPSPTDLASPPTSFTIAGGGFANAGFGLPVINFMRNGVALGQARATALSGSTSLTVPFPGNSTSLIGPLAGLSAGTVSVDVYNQTSAGSYSLIGSTTLNVIDTRPPPPQPGVSSITPNPMDLASPPTSFTIAGGGFANVGFGLPVINFMRNGVALGQARATALSGSTSLTVPFPSNSTSLIGPLPGLSAGSVSVDVYNQTGAGAYSYIGSTTVTVTDTRPCSYCVNSISANPINLATPPASFTIGGGGFANAGFGLPVINFMRSGVALGQARATGLSGSTSLTVPFPSNLTSLIGPLPGLSAGSVSVDVYNQTSAGTYAFIGSTTLTVNDTRPCSVCVNSISANPINLATPPASFTIGGGGFANAGFGLPVVNFIRNGATLGQARATALAGSNSLTVPFPSNSTSLIGPLPGLSSGSVSIEVYNQTGAGTYTLIGSTTLAVQ